VSASLPPELLTPEDREVHALELEDQITREWIRFAIADGVLTLALIAAAFVHATTNAISFEAFVGTLVVLVALSAALVRYWVIRRIRPLQARIAELRSAQ
jgi:hypothetical protein